MGIRAAVNGLARGIQDKKHRFELLTVVVPIIKFPMVRIIRFRILAFPVGFVVVDFRTGEKEILQIHGPLGRPVEEIESLLRGVETAQSAGQPFQIVVLDGLHIAGESGFKKEEDKKEDTGDQGGGAGHQDDEHLGADGESQGDLPLMGGACRHPGRGTGRDRVNQAVRHTSNPCPRPDHRPARIPWWPCGGRRRNGRPCPVLHGLGRGAVRHPCG